jgi:integrase/recombinase XerC
MLKTFLKYLEFEKRYSKHTLISYRTDLEQFQLFLSTSYNLVALQKTEHRHIRAWVVSLLDQQVSPRSVNRKIASLRSLYKFAISRELILSNPTDRIQALKVSKKLPQFVQEKNITVLFNNLNSDESYAGCRDALIIELFYGTGMRLSELIALTQKSIDFHERTIKVLGKGNKERVIPLYPQLIDKIKIYIAAKNTNFESNEDSPLIVTNKGLPAYPMMINRIVKKYLSRFSTVQKRSPHVLRHSFATHLLDKGADLNAVKDLLGHSSLAATQVYTHNSLEKLKKAFNQAHPKA